MRGESTATDQKWKQRTSLQSYRLDNPTSSSNEMGNASSFSEKAFAYRTNPHGKTFSDMDSRWNGEREMSISTDCSILFAACAIVQRIPTSISTQTSNNSHQWKHFTRTTQGVHISPATSSCCSCTHPRCCRSSDRSDSPAHSQASSQYYHRNR